MTSATPARKAGSADRERAAAALDEDLLGRAVGEAGVGEDLVGLA